jgi:hypothetical protein
MLLKVDRARRSPDCGEVRAPRPDMGYSKAGASLDGLGDRATCPRQRGKAQRVTLQKKRGRHAFINSMKLHPYMNYRVLDPTGMTCCCGCIQFIQYYECQFSSIPWADVIN